MTEPSRILYCHCAYAQVVPREVKTVVLRQLCESAASFEAVADLCELSARQDPTLKRLAGGAPLKIAACYPRAVQWLFAAAQAPLSPDRTQVLNMRVMPAAEVAAAISDPELKPNLPAGSPVVPQASLRAKADVAAPAVGPSLTSRTPSDPQAWNTAGTVELGESSGKAGGFPE